MIRVGLGIIMLGMGLTLTLADFKRVFLVPLALFGGVGLQFVVMPFLGWGIGHWMNLPRDMAVGLVLVSCCPGGYGLECGRVSRPSECRVVGQYDGNFNHVGGGADSIVNQVLCRGTSAG